MMLATIRALAAPILSLILLIMSNGLFNTFVSVRLEIEGSSPETIGLITSALYAGILAGSLCLDRWVAKVGHRASFLHAAALSTVLVLAQGLWINPFYWAALRFLGGFCMAGVFIGIESWFLLQSSPQTRSSILSLYVGIFYAALSLGQLLIHCSDIAGHWPFLIAAGLSLMSMGPLLVVNTPSPKIEQATKLSLSALVRLSPLGFTGGVISGVVLACVYGLVPVYAKESGLSAGSIGNLMATIIFGGLSLQWPLGRLADKKDRSRVLRLVSGCSLVLAILMGVTNPQSLWFFFLAWGFGGFAFTLYPLSMAYACESVEEKQIIPATASFVLAYGIGAIGGPLLAPIAMERWNGSALFYFLGVVFFVLSLAGMRWRKVSTALEKDLEP